MKNSLITSTILSIFLLALIIGTVHTFFYCCQCTLRGVAQCLWWPGLPNHHTHTGEVQHHTSLVKTKPQSCFWIFMLKLEFKKHAKDSPFYTLTFGRNWSECSKQGYRFHVRRTIVNYECDLCGYTQTLAHED